MRLFYNPVKQNEGHVKALKTFTGLPEDVFVSMVVFEGVDVVLNVDIPGVVVQDKEIVIEIMRHTEDRLSVQEMQSAYSQCALHFESTDVELYEEHVRRLEEKYAT